MKKYKPDYAFLMYSRRILVVLLIAMGLSACVASLYLPSENDAQTLNIPLNTLLEGRELYIQKCRSCHNLHLPSEYSKHEWGLILNKMQKPAKLNPSQRILIGNYLETSPKK
ncbi:MAG: hypothetical protein ACOYOV_10575 [Bacteroidales bacterium]